MRKHYKKKRYFKKRKTTFLGRAEKALTAKYVGRRSNFMPDKSLNKMVYHDDTVFRTNNGNSFVTWSIRMNDVYDPDPNLASGGLSGFAEIGAIYGRFTVLGFKYDIKLTNSNNFPINVAACYTPNGIVAANWANFNHAAPEQPGARTGVISASTEANVVHWKGFIRMRDVLGTKQAEMNTSYSGYGTGSSPSLFVGWLMGGWSGVIGNNFGASAGIEQSATYTFYTAWWERETLNG